ncbi:hypothetical protein [Rickettsia endosymbiont of Ceutorhynchus obstrictus]|uniref:hypothetical protein n=1 Tax=Rickettsia endosymbiont of Ceutorhynchus obstrictus TaxID=3066249 RepID=UPI0031330428
MHARTKIRQVFIELLQGKTLVGHKVFDSRLYTMEFTSLPGIIVFSINEEVTTNTITPPRSQDRIVKIIVECYAKATKEANITVDNIAAEIERLVANSIILKKLCKDYRLQSTDININSDGDQPVAVATLTFSVSYRTKEDKPEIII